MKLEHIDIHNKIVAELNGEISGGSDYKLGYGAGLTKAIDIMNKMVAERVKAGMNPPEDLT